MPLDKSRQRRALLVACGFSALAHSAASAHEAQGNCECLTEEEFRHVVSGGPACPLPARPLVISAADTDQCYRQDYGLGGCRAWDSEEQPVCAGAGGLPKPGRPSWCSASWCYVNVSTCSVSSSPSVFLPPERSLWYSYGACASVDHFQGWLAAESVRGHTLRAHLLSSIEGPLLQTYRTALELAGLRLEMQPLLMPSGGDAWQRCLDEVATGLLDLCIGDFWVTPSRMRNVSFATRTSIEALDVVKLARSTDATHYGASSATSLRPFTTRLWVVVMSITVVFVGIIFMFEQQDAVAAASCPTVKGSERRAQGSLSWSAGETLQLGYGHSCCLSAPKSSMGRGVTALLAAFWVMTLAGYTASWAAALTGNRSHEEDWAHLLSQGRRSLCVPSSLVSSIAEEGQVPLSVMVPMRFNEGKEFGNELEEANCDALLMPSSTVGQHEEVVLPRFAQAVTSQPVSYTYAQAISFWLEEADAARPAQVHPSLRLSAAPKEQDFHPLDVADFTGMYLLLGCALFLLLLYRLIWTCMERRTAPPTPTCCFQPTIETTAKGARQHWDVPELVTIYSDVDGKCQNHKVCSPGPGHQADTEALLLQSLAENHSLDAHEARDSVQDNLAQRKKKRRPSVSSDAPVLKRATPVQKPAEKSGVLAEQDICQEMPLVWDVTSKKTVQATPQVNVGPTSHANAGMAPHSNAGVRPPKGSKRSSNRAAKASRRDQGGADPRHHRDLVLRVPSDTLRLEPSTYAPYKHKLQDRWASLGEDDRYISALSRGSGSSEIDNEALRKCRECGERGNGRQRCGGDNESFKACLGSLAPTTVDQFEIRLNGHFRADTNIFATSL